MSEKPKGATIIIGTGAETMRAVIGQLPAGGLRRPDLDEVTVEPCYVGAHGPAWLCDLDAGRRKAGLDPTADGTLSIWVVQARWARGKNLACWCKPGAPCHADVLLELANP